MYRVEYFRAGWWQTYDTTDSHTQAMTLRDQAWRGGYAARIIHTKG